MENGSETSTVYKPIRTPDPNEHRLIARHSNRYYNNLVVAGVYSFPLDNSPLNTESSALFEYFRSALHECVQSHAFLSVVVRNPLEKNVTYAQCSNVDAKSHFNVINANDIPKVLGSSNENDLVSDTISHIQNDSGLTFFDNPDSTPPWRLDVLPLQSKDHPRVLACFTYSHILGDGMSGVTFHRTLLRSLNTRPTDKDKLNNIAISPSTNLPMLPTLPISLSYLLLPALGHYFPAFVRNLFGIKASVSGADDATWTGSKTFAARGGGLIRTAVELLSVNAQVLSEVLKECKNQGTKLTSVLNEIIARCLSKQLSMAIKAGHVQTMNLVCSTPINLRNLAGVSAEVFAVMASTAYTTHHFQPQPLANRREVVIDEQFWEHARTATHHLAAVASTLQDQPIGLLRFVSDINAWMKDKIGQTRDSSWELSNVMSFDGGSDTEKVTVEKMFYCQPADAVGPPMSFNAVSVKGGDLAICIAWQPRALGLPPGEDAEDFERRLVRDLAKDMDESLKAIAKGC